MDAAADCPLAVHLATRIRGARNELTGRWLERIVDRVSISINRVFPSDELLDSIPLLLLGIADHLETPLAPVSADTPVIAKAMELGRLRHEQGFGQHEILKEYEILGGILFAFMASVADELDVPCTRSELFICSQRVFHALSLVQQATSTQYLQNMQGKVSEREERLRAFNRALAHEFRNRMGAVAGAADVFGLPHLDDVERSRLVNVIARNVEGMRVTLDNLLELSRVDGDQRQQRHVELPDAVAEVLRQLRDAAIAKDVSFRLDPGLPRVEVNAAAVELVLMNLVANAIKYSDEGRREQWVEIRGSVAASDRSAPTEIIVEIADNGVGVPVAERENLFQRFFRAEGVVRAGIEGSGLGHSIVREVVQSLGGRAWAEFPAEGSVFAFSLPCRRGSDAPEIQSDVANAGATPP